MLSRTHPPHPTEGVLLSHLLKMKTLRPGEMLTAVEMEVQAPREGLLPTWGEGPHCPTGRVDTTACPWSHVAIPGVKGQHDSGLSPPLRRSQGSICPSLRAWGGGSCQLGAARIFHPRNRTAWTLSTALKYHKMQNKWTIVFNEPPKLHGPNSRAVGLFPRNI